MTTTRTTHPRTPDDASPGANSCAAFAPDAPPPIAATCTTRPCVNKPPVDFSAVASETNACVVGQATISFSPVDALDESLEKRSRLGHATTTPLAPCTRVTVGISGG